MNTSNTTTITNPKRKKLLNGKILFIFILIAIFAAMGFYYIKSKTSTNTQIQQQTAVTRRGDLKVTISGSGTLKSSSTLTALSNVGGTISKIHYKDGDMVKAGSLIMELDSSEAQLNVKKLENTIAQNKLSKDKILKSINNSELTAPISGEITDIKIKEGDNAGKDSPLITITDKSKLKLLLAFSNAYRKELSIGQEANIYAFDSSLNELYKLKGTISYISSSYEEKEDTETYNMEFVVENPGYLNDTIIASAEISASGKTLKSIGSNKLSYFDSVGVKSETGGLVESLNSSLGQLVKAGDLLADITNDDLHMDLETKALSLEDLENQLEYAKTQLSQYKIYSNISGTLSISDIKNGDAVKSGQTVFTVSNYDSMEFDIPIDELDIARIQIGQVVNITVDALPETTAKPLKGKVIKIALEGASNSGVTTYPVTVQLDEKNENLKVGMNANGEIIVNEKTNTLYIPIEAVQKRGDSNIVFVKNQDAIDTSKNNQPRNKTDENRSSEREALNTTESARTNQNTQTRRQRNTSGDSPVMNQQLQGYYEGATPTTVEVGINNEEYIEILSGLKERDIVILPPISASQSSSTRNQNTFNRNQGMPGAGEMPIRIPGGQGR